MKNAESWKEVIIVIVCEMFFQVFCNAVASCLKAMNGACSPRLVSREKQLLDSALKESPYFDRFLWSCDVCARSRSEVDVVVTRAAQLATERWAQACKGHFTADQSEERV